MTAVRLAHVLFDWAWQNSAGAAALALLVVLAQWLLRGRISARWRHNLWLLVVVRLLLPPLPALRTPTIRWPLARQSPTIAGKRPVSFVRATPSIPQQPARPLTALVTGTNREHELLIQFDVRTDFAFASQSQHEQVGSSAASNDAASLTRETVQTTEPPALIKVPVSRVIPAGSRPKPTGFPSTPPKRVIPWGTVLVSVWIAGALMLLVRLAWNTVRLWLATRRLPVVTDRSAYELLEDCCRLMRAPRVPILLEGPPDSGPALIGVFRPKLLLPPCVLRQFAWRELRLILLHELAHLRRDDVAISYLLSVLQAVHWFNPLVWLAFARIRCERELACDEAVLRATPWREARAYGSVIVKLLEALCHGPELAGQVGVIQTRELMHRRIAMIARFDGTRRSWSAGGVLVSLALGGAALISSVRAQEAPAQAPSAQQQRASDQEPQETAPQQDQDGDNDLEQARAAVNQQAQEPGVEPAQPEGHPVDGELVNAPGDPAAVPPAPGVAPAQPSAGEIAGTPDGAVTPAAGAPAPPPPAEGAPGPNGGFGGGGSGGGGFGGGPAPAMPGGRGYGAMGGAGRAGMMMRGMRGQMTGGAIIGDGQNAPDFYRTIEDTATIRADARTLEKLQKPAELKVDQVPLTDVMSMIADSSGVDLVLDRKALDEAAIDAATPVQINLREPRPADQVLQLALRLAGGGQLDFSIVDGVVLVSTKASLSRHLVTRIYDVGQLGSQQELSETIVSTVSPGDWGRGSDLRFFDGKLVVTASEPSQRQVEKLLALLGGNPGAGRMPGGGERGMQPMRGRRGLRGSSGQPSPQVPRGSGFAPPTIEPLQPSAGEPLQPPTVEPRQPAAVEPPPTAETPAAVR